MGEVTEGCINLQKEELHNIFLSPHIIRGFKLQAKRIADNIPCVGKMRNKKMLGLLKECQHGRLRWKDNLIMVLWVIGFQRVDWIDIYQHRDCLRALLYMLIHLEFHEKNILIALRTLSF